MEKRIKIVWILSLVSALFVIGVQGYWLYTQYKYVINTYIQEISDEVLNAGDKEFEIRKNKHGGNFSFSITKESEYKVDSLSNNPKRKTTMAFSSGKSDDGELLTPSERKDMIDSIMNRIKGMSTEDIKKDLLKSIEIMDAYNAKKLRDAKLTDKTPEVKTSLFNLFFNADLPEDSIISGMNRAFVNIEEEFRPSILDSILQAELPDINFSQSPWSRTDSIPMTSYWDTSGSLLSPIVNIYYAHNPFQNMGVHIKASIPPQPLFGKMAMQLLLSLGFILLLIGCLIFQIKTILKQQKIGEMRQSFVNTMIHELKRPVQTLKTFVAFLGDKEMRSDDEATEIVVQDSMFELDNLSAYLNKLKDMVRVDGSQTPLNLVKFNLEELIQKVIRLIHIPTYKKVEFHTSFDMDSPLIEADPVHIANVLSNLIENAIKYSENEVNIEIKATQKRNELWLSVSDDGIGIPIVEQEKVFAKFYRGSNLPDQSIPGLGLGLSYVKLISEAHHGYVSLKSHVGQGTSITLYLPQ